jgi:hypothetical protein
MSVCRECCLVEVSVSSWSLIQSTTDCGMSECHRGDSIIKRFIRNSCAMRKKKYIVLISLCYFGDPSFKYHFQNWVFWGISDFIHPSRQTSRCYFSLCHNISQFLSYYLLIMAFCNTGGVHSELITLPLHHSIVIIEVYISVLSFSSLLIYLGFLDHNHLTFLSNLLFIHSSMF